MPRLELHFTTLAKVLLKAHRMYKHNVVTIWGELGDGKTTLALQILWWIVQDWNKVLSFVLEPHVCIKDKCKHSFDADQPYTFEVGCPECGKETVTEELSKAVKAVYRNWSVVPFPLDRKTGEPKSFPKGQKFTLNTSKSRGEITRHYPYLNFTFREFTSVMQNAVQTRTRVPCTVWDDLAVYFHKSNIQYMNPEVKQFFSNYNFIRQYVANVILTVPVIDFVPEQLFHFCNADIMVTRRGYGDFDTKKHLRSFWGKARSFLKNYDGRNVTWSQMPSEPFTAYEEIRHAHVVEVMEHPERVLVVSMPTKKEFTEFESLLD